jgi:hypothetical protein
VNAVTDYRKLGRQDHDDTLALYAEMTRAAHDQRETLWKRCMSALLSLWQNKETK